MNPHSLRAKLFLTISAACVVVALAVGAFSRRAASEGFTAIFDGPGLPPYLEGEPGEKLHRLGSDESLPHGLELHEEAQYSFDRSLFFSILIVAGAALIGTALLTIWIVRPIESLTRSAAGLRSSDDRVPHFRAEMRDRGEVGQLASTLNALAEDVERTETLRRNLVHDVAHELRTPLTAICGQIEAMQDGLLKSDDATLGGLLAHAKHLSRIVEDLQEIALAEAGELRLECKSLDLSSVVRELIQAPESRVSEAYAKVVVDIPSIPPVRADKTRLLQILINLLNNAVRHNSEQGVVRLRARESGALIEIDISDQGAGIEASELPKLFERFYRTDSARDRFSGGVGLGLAITRQLVEAQGGTIRVESEVGHGTSFLFTLPKV